MPAGALLLVPLWAGACDIPTALPRVETRLLMPGATLSMSVDQLLPTGVMHLDSVFLVVITPIAFSLSAEELCPACTPHMPAPKPAFTATLAGELALPTQVGSATLASGVMTVRLENELSFDVLRPAGASEPGSLVIEVLSAGRTLATQLVSGTTDSLPARGSLIRVLPLAAGEVVTPVTVRIQLSSPAGDPVMLQPSDRLTVFATPGDVHVSEARIALTPRGVHFPPRPVDLSDIDEPTTRRVRGAAIVTQVANPFGVAGNLQLRITAPGMLPIVKPYSLSVETGRIELTEAEIGSILGRAIELTMSGAVGSAANLRIRPTDRIEIRTRFELLLEIGSGT